MGGVGWRHLQSYLHPPWVVLGGSVCRVTCIHYGWRWVPASAELRPSTILQTSYNNDAALCVPSSLDDKVGGISYSHPQFMKVEQLTQ